VTNKNFEPIKINKKGLLRKYTLIASEIQFINEKLPNPLCLTFREVLPF
jgi:hypothetical protein